MIRRSKLRHVLASERVVLSSVILTNLAAIGLGVVSGVITARGLGPADRGVLVALTTWTALVGLIALAGLDEAIIWRARGSFDRALGLARGLRGRVSCLSALALVVMTPLAIWLAGGFPAESVAAGAVIALTIPLTLLVALAHAPLRAGRRLWAWNGLRLIPPGFLAVAMTGLLLMNKLTVLTAVGALLAANLATLAATSVVLRGKPETEVSHLEVPEVAAYGRRLLGVTIPNMLSQRADQLILSVLAAPAVLGVYSVAVAVAAMVLTLSVSVEQYAFPRFAAERPGDRALLNITLLASAGALTLCMLIALAAGPLIDLIYGDGYRDASSPLLWLLAGTGFRVTASPMISDLKASGAVAALRASSVAVLITVVGLGVILFPLLGVVGMAAAVAVSQALLLGIVTTAQIRRRRGGSSPHEG